MHGAKVTIVLYCICLLC